MKKALVRIFILVFYASMLIGAAKANPYFWYQKVHPDEHTKPPRISVRSPTNNTVYSEDNVSLSFEVYLGDSKTALDALLLTVEYELDWRHISNNKFAPWSSPNPFVHEVNLMDIPEGFHSIVIHATEIGVYSNATAFTIDSSETIYFTINTNPETTIPEFPSWTILPITLAATLIVAVMKRKQL